jgi:autotransporter translocation and assembly factor TamB
LRDAYSKVIGRIDEIRLRYDLRTLLEKRLLVHDVTLIRPDVTLAQAADGSLNLSHAAAPAATTPPAETPERAGLPIEIDLASLQLRDRHLNVQYAAIPGLRTVTGLQMQLRGKLTADAIQIELQHLQAHTLPAQVALHTLRGTIQQRHGAIHIAALQFKTDATEMRTTGTLPGGPEPASLNLQFAPLDVGEIGRILDDDTLQGRLQFSLDVIGPPDHLDVRSQVQTPSGSIDFNGHVDIATTPPQYQGQLDITKLDVSALIHRLTLQSDLNLHLEVEGKGLTLSELQGHMHMQIAPSRMGNIAINPSQLRIDAASQRLQIHDFQLDTSAAHLTMNGALDLVGETDLTYTLQAKLLNLQPLLDIAWGLSTRGHKFVHCCLF